MNVSLVVHRVGQLLPGDPHAAARSLLDMVREFMEGKAVAKKRPRARSRKPLQEG